MTVVADQTAGVASTADIRSRFPALERMHDDVHVAYFDGPGGTQVPRQVADAVAEYLLRHNANTHWDYPTSAETDAIIAGAREAMADFLGASPTEIVFGANMTTLTFHLSRALGRDLSPGDEIVVTELDHHANIAPWQALERERGVRLRWARLRPENGQLDLADLERQVSDRTRLLAIGAASNALGTITDVRRAAEIAHAAGARVFVDAVHYAPHALVDVAELQCDFLACSAYKFYGPHVGILYGRRELLEELDAPKLLPAPDAAPERLETGTQNHEAMAGTAAAVDFLASLAPGETRRERLRRTFLALHRRGADLFARLHDGLARIPGVRIYGPRPGAPRTPTIAFTLQSVPAVEVTRHLARNGVYTSHGDFYATTVVDRLGLAPEGLVRAGCACYTTEAEIDRLVQGVRELAP